MLQKKVEGGGRQLHHITIIQFSIYKLRKMFAVIKSGGHPPTPPPTPDTHTPLN